MNASDRWWVKAIDLVLSCYPKTWRDRFGPQIQADLEDARSEQSTLGELVLWMCASLWDLVRGSVPAHLAARKEKAAVLAVVGGGSSGQQDPVDYMRAWGFVIRQIPSWFVSFGLTLLGAALVGLWLYDVSMFPMHGLVGLGLVAAGGPYLYVKIQTSRRAIRKSEDPTEKFGFMLGFLVAAISIYLTYFYLFGWVSEQANDAAQQLPPTPMVGVVGMPHQFIVGLMGYVLVMILAGMWMGLSVNPTSRKLLAIVTMAVVVVGGALSVHAGAFNALGATALALPLMLMSWGVWRRRSWADLLSLAGAILPLPLVLGFVVGTALDISKTQGQLESMVGVRISSPTLLEQAKAHHQALDRVRAGEPERVFWDYLESAKTSRQDWEKAKPWTRLYPPQPSGVLAMSWCVALSGRHPQRPVEYCASQPDRNRILERPPQIPD